MNADRPKASGLGRCVLAGLIAGLVAALLANLSALVLARQFNQPLDQLNWFVIFRVAMVSCAVASFVYAGLVRWTKLAWPAFAMVAFLAATAASIWLKTHPFILTGSVNPLPFVIAIAAVVLIPVLAPALPQPKIAEHREKNA